MNIKEPQRIQHHQSLTLHARKTSPSMKSFSRIFINNGTEEYFLHRTHVQLIFLMKIIAVYMTTPGLS